MSETSHTYFENGKRAVLLIGVSNLYVVMLQYMYSLSRQGAKEIKELKNLKYKNNFSSVSSIDEDEMDEDDELKPEERMS